VLGSTQPAPLLVLACFGAKKQLTKNKSHGVTPFWHNDTRSRVTVTFGARRIEALPASPQVRAPLARERLLARSGGGPRGRGRRSHAGGSAGPGPRPRHACGVGGHRLGRRGGTGEGGAADRARASIEGREDDGWIGGGWSFGWFWFAISHSVPACFTECSQNGGHARSPTKTGLKRRF